VVKVRQPLNPGGGLPRRLALLEPGTLMVPDDVVQAERSTYYW
jgi:hypothetical protein